MPSRKRTAQVHHPRVFWQRSLPSMILPGYAPFPGAVAIASVNHPSGHQKPRPVVLIRAHASRDTWWAWALTSLSSYADGNPRASAAGSHLVGLAADGYVWGSARTEIANRDILGVIWAAPPELIEACAAAEHGSHAVNDPRGYAIRLHLEHLEGGWFWPKPGVECG